MYHPSTMASSGLQYLSPIESARLIMEKNEYVSINMSGISKVADMVIRAIRDGSMEQAEFSAHPLHPKTHDQPAIDWVFFMDTINFCFWYEEDNRHYEVSYKGVKYSGYFAACAAVNKAIDNGIPITNASWMANVTVEEIDEIFKTDDGYSIPLLSPRTDVIRDSGRRLLENWNGSFYNCVIAAGDSAQRLLRIVVENFPSFQDLAEFKGVKVSFLKRAQILVADVYGALSGTEANKAAQIAQFADIDTLTMFADYRVPQVLAYLGAIDYSQTFSRYLGRKLILETGGIEEVSVRAASILAVELIVSEVESRRSTDPSVPKTTQSAVDLYLWMYRRQFAAIIEELVPFHRVRTIYY